MVVVPFVQMLSRNFLSCFCVLVSSLGLLVPSGRAEHSHTQPTTVTISVRTIQATEPTHHHANDTEKSPALHLASSLQDLEARLSNLPFSNFQLIASKEETLTLKKKNSLQLPNGQSLTFRPVYLEDRKIGLWLDWRDKDGSEILNTRVHFDSNDAVLTGTDCAADAGLILAIKAVPVGN